MMQSLDFDILNWIKEHLACDFLDTWMPRVSALGNWNLLWFSLIILFLIKQETRKWSVRLLAGLLAGLLVANLCLKNLVARPRPCWIVENYPLLVKNPKDYSFPSGHSLAAFVSATILLGWKRSAGIAAFILSVVIGFSRLYLYVHFPSDVLCGAVLGIAIGAGVLYFARRLEDRKSRESLLKDKKEES